MVIDGKKIASEIIENLKKQGAPKGFLAVFLIGDDLASESFVKQKEKTAKELGVDFRIFYFPERITQDELKNGILKIVEDETCGGAIVQLPLPAHINRQDILDVIPSKKDVDVLGGRASDTFRAGGSPISPPAVGVVESIIHNSKFAIKSSRVAVVGLGFLVGNPISGWLKGKCAELSLLDIGSDFSALRNADVIVLGTGQAGFIKPGMLKNNALVIDFGYGTANGKISGDFEPPAGETNITYTPTPGGTGPILVAKLFENFYKLASLQK